MGLPMPTVLPRRGRSARALLATLTGNAFLVLGSLVFAILATLTGWMTPRRGTLFYVWAKLWSRGLLLASGVRLRVEGREGLARDRSYVFMVNHQSMFDIPVLLASLPVPARFMAKRELFRIPIFGWSLKAGGFIPVDRGESARAKDAFQEAVRRLQRGASVLLFPEETRSLDGRLLPFRRGGFLLALRSGLPVVPVGISGTFHIQPRGSYRIHPGVVAVRYGTPVDPRSYNIRNLTPFVDQIRKHIAELAEVPEAAESPTERGAGA
jgi:1-acyl-sn-glycerol-3-phosphate acyltransferase